MKQTSSPTKPTKKNRPPQLVTKRVKKSSALAEFERAVKYLRKTGKPGMTWQEALGKEPLRETHR